MEPGPPLHPRQSSAAQRTEANLSLLLGLLR